jgi:hypothetical protein
MLVKTSRDTAIECFVAQSISTYYPERMRLVGKQACLRILHDSTRGRPPHKQIDAGRGVTGLWTEASTSLLSHCYCYVAVFRSRQPKRCPSDADVSACGCHDSAPSRRSELIQESSFVLANQPITGSGCTTSLETSWGLLLVPEKATSNDLPRV